MRPTTDPGIVSTNGDITHGMARWQRQSMRQTSVQRSAPRAGGGASHRPSWPIGQGSAGSGSLLSRRATTGPRSARFLPSPVSRTSICTPDPQGRQHRPAAPGSRPRTRRGPSAPRSSGVTSPSRYVSSPAALSDLRALHEPADVRAWLEEPPSTGDPRWDTLLAAATRRECRRLSIRAPGWTPPSPSISGGSRRSSPFSPPAPSSAHLPSSRSTGSGSTPAALEVA